MRRAIPAIVIILLILGGVLVALRFMPRSGDGSVLPIELAKPLRPQPAYLQTANQFLTNWAEGNTAGMYNLLSDHYKQLIPEKDFAAQIEEIKLTNPHPVAHTGTNEAAYVIARVETTQPSGTRPIVGYSLLLKSENGQWRVALFIAEEKVAEKYTDLKLAPGKEKSWIVTYQDEQGQIATVNLPDDL